MPEHEQPPMSPEQEGEEKIEMTKEELREILTKAINKNLEGADLQGAFLESSDLRSYNFKGADLRGANLSAADLGNANLDGAQLEGADFYNASMSAKERDYIKSRGGLNVDKV